MPIVDHRSTTTTPHCFLTSNRSSSRFLTSDTNIDTDTLQKNRLLKSDRILIKNKLSASWQATPPPPLTQTNSVTDTIPENQTARWHQRYLCFERHRHICDKRTWFSFLEPTTQAHDVSNTFTPLQHNFAQRFCPMFPYLLELFLHKIYSKIFDFKMRFHPFPLNGNSLHFLHPIGLISTHRFQIRPSFSYLTACFGAPKGPNCPSPWSHFPFFATPPLQLQQLSL